MNNATWAHCLIDQLIQQGVRHFCIAPGSRSTPLALAAARHPKALAPISHTLSGNLHTLSADLDPQRGEAVLNTRPPLSEDQPRPTERQLSSRLCEKWGLVNVHFDERGLGFFALGLSCANRAPAVLIVTSGTAVGNLMPAVMEAAHSQIPLIILTADRPPELRDCTANQSTDQVKFFHKFVLWYTELPCPDQGVSEELVRTQAANAFFHAQRKGPVHLNCPFREPLFEPPSPQKEGIAQQQFFPTFTFDPSSQQLLSQAKRGVILIGRMPFHSDLAPVIRLAERLGWPIFADLLSNADRSSSQIIHHFDYLLRSKQTPTPDLILHVGGRFTSKAILNWIQETNAHLLQISSHPERIEPLLTRSTRVWADPATFCDSIPTAPQDPSWLQEWQTLDHQLEEHLEQCFSEPHPFTEADLMRWLAKQLAPGWSLFLANSMPIRDAEHFFFPRTAAHYFANRGLSGIDGQIATAAGIALSLQKPLCAVIGDQSALHDLNSLALLHAVKTPLLLIISNNFGGGIFSHLPVVQEEEHFEQLFGAGHSFRFDRIAEMFQIPYTTKLEDCFPCTRPCILEVTTSRKENTAFQKKLQNHVSCCIRSK